MTELEELEQYLCNNKIDYFEKDLSETSFESVIIKAFEKVGIFVNKELPTNEKIHYIKHELSHYNTSSFYTFRSTNKKIDKQETKAINYMCKNYLPLYKIKELFCMEYEPYEIAEILNISELSVNDAIKYMYRKGILEICSF